MPLPQQVIERLGQEPPKTPGWSAGVLTFSAGIFGIALMLYLGLAFGYSPYIDGQIAQIDSQMSTIAKSITPEDQVRTATFYSQVVNIKKALQDHVIFSRFLDWFEKHTEANVYYMNFSFAPGNLITLSGVAKTEADINQQLAIFEAAPEITKASISSVTLLESNGMWQFAAALTVDPNALLRAPQTP